jgi:hypothetical protein
MRLSIRNEMGWLPHEEVALSWFACVARWESTR